MANCNKCETDHCKQFKGTNCVCKNYLSPSIFKTSIFERLLANDSVPVLTLLKNFGLRVEGIKQHPGFILISE